MNKNDSRPTETPAGEVGILRRDLLTRGYVLAVDVPPEQVRRALRADISHRLHGVCLDWTQESFDSLVDDMTDTAVKDIRVSTTARQRSGRSF